MKRYLVFDTETTGLIESESLPLAKQPQIIELGLLVLDENRDIIEEYGQLINPGVPLPEVITKITGITDADLKDAPTFAQVVPKLRELFLGAHMLVAHNARFDQMMLVHELMRLGLQFQFPYPPAILDTRTIYRGKLQKWAMEMMDEAPIQTHRAVDDCKMLLVCWRKTKPNN